MIHANTGLHVKQKFILMLCFKNRIGDTSPWGSAEGVCELVITPKPPLAL